MLSVRVHFHTPLPLEAVLLYISTTVSGTSAARLRISGSGGGGAEARTIIAEQHLRYACATPSHCWQKLGHHHRRSEWDWLCSCQSLVVDMGHARGYR